MCIRQLILGWSIREKSVNIWPCPQDTQINVLPLFLSTLTIFLVYLIFIIDKNRFLVSIPHMLPMDRFYNKFFIMIMQS